MAFDQGQSDQPLVQPAKRTTKVNLTMALAIVVFFIIGILITWFSLTRDRRGSTMDHPPTRRMNP